MTISASMWIRRNDRRPSIESTISYNNGAPVDLTGSTVKFVMRPQGSAAPKVNAAAVIVNAVAGLVRYDWALGDTNTSGLFLAEWHVTYADTTTLTAPNNSSIGITITEYC